MGTKKKTIKTEVIEKARKTEAVMAKLGAIEPPGDFLIAGADKSDELPAPGPLGIKAIAEVQGVSVKSLRTIAEDIENDPKRLDAAVRGFEIDHLIPVNRIKIRRSVLAAKETAEKRMDHAMAALVRKGIYGESYADLCAAASKLDLPEAEAALDLLLSHMETGVIRGKTIDRKTWEGAIELTMLLHEPKVFLDEKAMLAPFLLPHAASLFVCAVLLAYAKAVHRKVTEQNNALDKLNEACEDMGGIGGLISVAKSVGSYAVVDRDALIRKHKAERLTLEERLKDAERKTAKTESAALAPLRAELAFVKAENETLRTKLAEQAARLSSLCEDLWAARTNPGESGSGVLIELPKEGVVFAGGHPNMVKNLRERFPAWRYIDADDRNFPAFTAAEIVFIWSEHMSHPTYQRLMSMLPSGCPVRYCYGTNPDRLLSDMRKNYTEAKAARQKGEKRE